MNNNDGWTVVTYKKKNNNKKKESNNLNKIINPTKKIESIQNNKPNYSLKNEMVKINNDQEEDFKIPNGMFKITSDHVKKIVILRSELGLKQRDIDLKLSLPKNTCQTIEEVNSIVDEKNYSKILQFLTKNKTKI